MIVHVASEFHWAFANASDEASRAVTGTPNRDLWGLAEGVFDGSLDMLFNESRTAYEPVFPTSQRSREGRDDVINDISQLLGESLRLSSPRSKSGYY